MEKHCSTCECEDEMTPRPADYKESGLGKKLNAIWSKKIEKDSVDIIMRNPFWDITKK